MDTGTHPYRAAADRAQAFAELIRQRATDPETKRTLSDIERHLNAAATILANHQPTGHDVPTAAVSALRTADALAGGHPSTRYFREFTHYVTQPITGRRLPLPDPLRPITAERITRETELDQRFEQLHSDSTTATEHVTTWLADVLTVWADWLTLANEVSDEYKRAYPNR